MIFLNHSAFFLAGVIAMTQQDINELEKKANEDNPEALYELGILHSVNNYYEKGKMMIEEAAERGNEDAKLWIKTHNTLSEILKKIEHHKLIKVWNIKKGFLSQSFECSPLEQGSIMIFINKTTCSEFKNIHVEMIKEEYFHTMLDLWKAYAEGKIPLNEIKPTRNAKYLVSILKYVIEVNKDLKDFHLY